MQEGRRQVGEMGETAQQCGRQERKVKSEGGREIIACLRAAILSCAMNTKDYTAP